jgi:hypothetical protein
MTHPITRANLPPDPERMNDDRAGWAGLAIAAFKDATGTDDEDMLCDLLADLMQGAAGPHKHCGGEHRSARDHYEEETTEISL